MSRNDDSEAGPPAGGVERRARPGAPSLPRVDDLAFLDDLSGLPNRRFANHLLQESWAELSRRHAEVSVILIDLDGFKEVNDRYGHAAGDEVLRGIAGVLRQHFRDGDLTARYGGDEFLVVLPGAGPAMAAALADRAREAVNATSFSTAAEGQRIGVPLSFSMGVASCPADGATGPELVTAADRRLYTEKRARSRPRRRGRALAAALGALALASIWAGTQLLPREPRDPDPPRRLARRSVAVLGFKNLSGRPDAAWLSTALAEMLSAELAAADSLRVIPGEVVARARTDLALPEVDALAADTLRRVHNRLGSDVVVLGSYLEVPAEAGSQVRLDVRLQDAASGEAIGVVSQTGRPAELLDLVARAGDRLRRSLGAAPLSTSAAVAVLASRPASVAAARLYAEGLDRLRLFDALGARERLERAVAADPDWPLAHAALAEAWLALGYDGRAREAAQRAFERSARLSPQERLVVEARYREAGAEWEAAIRANSELVRLAPDDVEHGLSLARVQRLGGKDADARGTLAALRALPPPQSEDPRIDLIEAEAAQDFEVTRMAAARAAQKAAAQGARGFVARARLLEAWALGEVGRFIEATMAAQEARQIYEESGDKGGLARALNRIAAVRPNQDDLLAARKLYEEAARLAREVGDRRWTALVLNNLALTYSDSGDLIGARPLYDEALRLAREVDARRAVTIVVTNLGRDLNNLGRADEARAYLEEALAGYRALGDRGSEVYALNNLGNGALSRGDLDAAQRLYEEALPLSAESGERRIRAYTILDLGDVHYWRGELAPARKRYEEALALRRELGVQLDAAESQLMLARLALVEGDPRRAESLSREAMATFDKEGSSAASWARALLAEALLDQGRVGEAQAALQPALAAAPRIQHAITRLAVRTAGGRVVAAAGSVADAERRLDEAIAEADRLGLVPESFLARLARAELRQRAGRPGAADDLRALASDAQARGFGLIARASSRLTSGPKDLD